ncbi:hypothetical protein CEXT_337621 [Caerostris extrusa]|uniref:Uncharacterized protein n=1 Tax=Caerostris extrusa TaxID=172846 RepID=A0AAV4QKY0_CAEEX|nr:hypothetical protein CEXT_337621 [Caerostris extrusa]
MWDVQSSETTRASPRTTRDKTSYTAHLAVRGKVPQVAPGALGHLDVRGRVGEPALRHLRLPDPDVTWRKANGQCMLKSHRFPFQSAAGGKTPLRCYCVPAT